MWCLWKKKGGGGEKKEKEVKGKEIKGKGKRNKKEREKEKKKIVPIKNFKIVIKWKKNGSFVFISFGRGDQKVEK